MSCYTMLKAWSLALIFLNTALFASVDIKIPKGWELIEDPAQLPKTVECVLVGPSKNKFIPTVNISSQQTNLSTEEYFSEAKRHHEHLPFTKCHPLGVVETPIGKGLLMQIDQITELGDICSWQLIQTKEGQAIVVTATSLHEEFKAFAPLFSECFKSLSLKNGLKRNETSATY
jgi:hypothetical protein